MNKYIKKIKLKSFYKKSGKLIPIEFRKNFPINVKRIFFIYGKKNFVRANHAHKKCSQLFIPVNGSMSFYYKNKEEQGEKILNYKKKEAFLLAPHNWCKIKFKSNNGILMVICDRFYEYNDYIDNYKDFLKIIK